MRNSLLFIPLVLFLLTDRAYGQSDTISREMLIGKWTANWIYDTTAYFAIPDSLKNEQSISTILYPFRPVMELHEDGTMQMISDWFDEPITGEWKLQNDSLHTKETYKKDISVSGLRYIAPGMIEVTTHVMYGAGGKPEMRYYLWVKNSAQ